MVVLLSVNTITDHLPMPDFNSVNWFAIIFFDKCCDVVISLVFVAFSVEMGEEGTAYYDLFEKVLFDDAAKFYSQIALELLQSGSEGYVEKVMKLLIAERERGEGFLKEASLEELMKVVMKILGEKLKDLDTTSLKELLSPALRHKLYR